MSRTVRWRSPGRVNVIGEHTDYNEGFCLPMAIVQGCNALAVGRDDDTVEVSSAQRTDSVLVRLADAEPGVLTGDEGWASYVVGVIWALQKRGHRVPGISISVDGDVPAGAGLSSSAALECAVAAAVNDLAGLGLDRAELVSVARQSENDFVGLPNGGMDQLASVFGQRDHVLLCDMRSLDVEPVRFSLAESGLTLLVVNSRAPHQLTDGHYAQRRASCDEAARRLGVAALRDVSMSDLPAALARLDDALLARRTRHVVTENDRTLAVAELLRRGQVREIGPLLSASHASMRDDFEITVAEVDLAAEVLESSGAYGARMTGGGFGGCVIALIDADRAWHAAGQVTQAFREHEFAAPDAFTATAMPGTHPLV
ncbi:MAG TPA: galactokinase [Jatrophihabitans sp.]|jgi:galactokinase